MRAIVLAVMIIQLGLGYPGYAEEPAASEPPIGATLPLFEKNHCVNIKDPADRLFCGDPQLNDLAGRLNDAIRGRLDRRSDHRLAIAENAEWITNRNSSCSIFRNQNIPSQNVGTIKQCLVKETEERIALLSDPNFDCLAANTAAGSLICSDPSLAIAEADLNDHALALIAKLKEDEARNAHDEYARWIRSRDRKCSLVGKENVPLEDVSSSEDCLADFMNGKTAELIAAKGDPKRVFGRHPLPAAPDADAVDLCVAQIHAANACGDFLSVNRVIQIDSDIQPQSASVLAEIEMVVLSPFAVCSPIASGCTGTCWDLKSGQAQPSQPRSRDSFAVAHRLRIEKSFEFQKADSGGWRCGSATLQPIAKGISIGRGP
ncbi:lysozyme inhibitor LprI family protein [Bradyrhizobium sp. S69]|uniref:lysozyme inhibitor LprI family protein n=1 Tax=Bradyrhizobium sp. S69 TaxID=1641856 RepID=UPI00131B67EB|nr:lysozyme inhibitor LprI family protein [Bradyrhizobium sp. S69]